MPLIKGDYSNLKQFKKCYSTVGSTIQKLSKNERQYKNLDKFS